MNANLDRMLIVTSAAGAVFGWALLVTPFAIASFGGRRENLIALGFALGLLLTSVITAYAVRAGEARPARRRVGTALFAASSLGVGLLLLLPAVSFPFY